MRNRELMTRCQDMKQLVFETKSNHVPERSYNLTVKWGEEERLNWPMEEC